MTEYRSLLSWIYLLFALSGAVLTALANIDFINQYGPTFDLDQFIKLANINPAARSLSRDLMVSASAIFIWIIIESRRLKVKNMWIVFVGTFAIAFAFSAPLFLFLRERRLIEMERELP